MCAPVASTATPSATATATLTATVSPTPSPSPSAPPSGAFLSVRGFYRIALPPPWRRSDCLSATPGPASQVLALDTFVTVREEDEQMSDIGASFDQISVRAEPGQTPPRRWIESGQLGGSVGMTMEDATFDGRPAVRVRNAPQLSLVYVMSAFDVLYVVGYRRAFDSATDPPDIERLLSTFHALAPAERPQPPPVLQPSPRAAQAVADALADGFAKKDADALAAVMAPCMSQGNENAGALTVPRSRFVAQLKSSFAAGLTVTVPSTTVERDQTGSFVRATWTDPGRPPQRRDLYLRDDSSRWTWFLVLNRRPS